MFVGLLQKFYLNLKKCEIDEKSWDCKITLLIIHVTDIFPFEWLVSWKVWKGDVVVSLVIFVLPNQSEDLFKEAIGG